MVLARHHSQGVNCSQFYIATALTTCAVRFDSSVLRNTVYNKRLGLIMIPRPPSVAIIFILFYFYFTLHLSSSHPAHNSRNGSKERTKMDPMMALAVASSVVQFVDFGLKLFKATAEIAGSARGATAGNLGLENVYAKLQTFTSKLDFNLADSEPSPHGNGLPAAVALGKAHIKAIQPHVTAIAQITADCRVVCDKLLDVVKGLRVDPNASNLHLRSLGAALKTAFRAKKLAGLEAQLKRFQDLLALHYFPLLM